MTSSDSCIPVTYRYLNLPLTQLRLCVKIWNSDEPSRADIHAADCSDNTHHTSIPLPRIQDTHIVLIHGWLDNVASYDRLCPLLIHLYAASSLCNASSPSPSKLAISGSIGADDEAKQSKLVCYVIEMSGHGDSQHRSMKGSYHPTEHAIDMVQAIRQLRIPDRFFLCGHSMGGAVAYMLAAAYGNRLNGMILIDSIGPWASPLWMHHKNFPDASIIKLAAGLQEHTVTAIKRQLKLYESKEAIIARYVKLNPFMEEESALSMARQAVKEVYRHKKTSEQIDAVKVRDIMSPTEWDRGWIFKHDSRLSSAALLTPLEPNTLSQLRSVTAPVLVFLATNTLRKHVYSTIGRDPKLSTHWILPESNPNYSNVIHQRMVQFQNPAFKLKMIEGDHHIHMDKVSCNIIAEEIMEWMIKACMIQQHSVIQPIYQVANPIFFSHPPPQPPPQPPLPLPPPSHSQIQSKL